MSLPVWVNNIFSQTLAFDHRRKSRATLHSIIDITTRKVLLISFQLNSHTSGFHPQAQVLESPCTTRTHRPHFGLLSSFHLNGRT